MTQAIEKPIFNPNIDPEDEEKTEKKKKLSLKTKLGVGIAAAATLVGIGGGVAANSGGSDHEKQPNVATAPAFPGEKPAETAPANPETQTKETLTLHNFPYTMTVDGEPKTFIGLEDLEQRFSIDTEKYATDEDIAHAFVDRVNQFTTLADKFANDKENLKKFQNVDPNNPRTIVSEFVEPAVRGILVEGSDPGAENFADKIIRGATDYADGMKARRAATPTPTPMTTIDNDQTTVKNKGDGRVSDDQNNKALLISVVNPAADAMEYTVTEKWELGLADFPTGKDNKKAWKAVAYDDGGRVEK